MHTALVALHGITLNGAHMRAALVELVPRLPPGVELVCPDAPHEAARGTVERMHAFSGAVGLAPPHRAWWDASDDGRVYEGWDATLESLRKLVAPFPRVGVLGFSQGAIVGAALAALSARGAFPPIAFVVLVAGRAPRSDALLPFFDQPIGVPSLHVWGENDAFAVASAPELLERFDASTRQRTTWAGPHVVPTRGPAADAIAQFLERHASEP